MKKTKVVQQSNPAPAGEAETRKKEFGQGEGQKK